MDDRHGPGYIKQLADQRDMTVDAFLEEMVAKYKTPGRIAQNLACNPSAVRKHLIRLGYKPVHDIRWAKSEQSA